MLKFPRLRIPTTTVRLWNILTPKERRGAARMFFLILLGTLLEMLGLGLVIPAIAVITQADLAVRYPALASLLGFLGNFSHQQLVVAFMLALVATYFVKVVALAFIVWKQTRFVFEVQAELSQRLFAGYLRQPYAFHLQRNSAQMIRNATTVVGLLVGSLTASLTLLTELMVLVGFSAVLIAVEPLGALLVVAVIGGVSWVFYQVTQQHVLRWGGEWEVHEGLRIQHLQQGLGGAKEVKLLGREEDFIAQYQQHNVGSARASQRQQAFILFPRLMLELLAVGGIAAMALLMIGQGKPLEALLPTVGLFAAAAFRLMPSVNRVLNAMQTARFAVPVIGTIHGEIGLIVETSVPRRTQLLPFHQELTLENVTFRYSSAPKPALHELSLKIPCRTSVGFVGPSGAGKSTLVDILLGLLTPGGGTVRVDGHDIQSNLRGWQDQIGYVPQFIFLTDDTLRHNVALGLPNKHIDDEAVWRAIRAAQLENYVSGLPEGLDALVGERGVRLSGGQRQRIGIARALYHDPSVLVLDEATSSLDTAIEEEVMDAVYALRGKTILVVAHRLSTVERCDRLYRLEEGRVADGGKTAQVLENVIAHIGLSPG